MTKKEYLLKVIEILGDKREIGYAIKKLIEVSVIDDEVIDSLYDIIQYSIKSIELGKNSEQLQRSLDVLQKIKLLEQQDQSQNQKELDLLIAHI